MVEKQEDLMHISLNRDERTDHLPQLLRDVIARLRVHVCTKTPLSIAAGQHGNLRRKQGYTVAMMIEESRILQVCLFVATIADEVDAQLKQQTVCYMAAHAV